MTRAHPALGDEAALEVTVTDEMLVEILGRRIHPLYATAWMVRHMEEAARLLIEPHLGPTEDGTGYAVSCVHQRPARPGDRLRVTARCTRIDDRECEAVVTVEGAAGRVGIGTVTQRFVPKGSFQEG